MVDVHLPQSLIQSGAKILEETDRLDMQAQGAMWVFDYQLQDWRFYIVTSLVDTLGRRKTYKLLLEAFENVEISKDMTIEDVHLGSPTDDFFLRISQGMVIPNIQVMIRHILINGIVFDGLIYRTVGEAPSAEQARRIERRFSKRVKDRAALAAKR